MIAWLKRRFDQEGFSIVMWIVIIAIGAFVLLRPTNKQVNKSDFNGATIGTVDQRTISESKKFLKPWVSASVGTGTNEDNRANIEVKVGVTHEF